MNPLLIGLLVALAISAGGNVLLGISYLDTRDDLAHAESDRDWAHKAASNCSAGVQKLHSAAAIRAQEAASARVAADHQASTHSQRAQQILAAPPADPTDDCKSAGAAIDAWLQGKAKP